MEAVIISLLQHVVTLFYTAMNTEKYVTHNFVIG